MNHRQSGCSMAMARTKTHRLTYSVAWSDRHTAW